jgi:hypothetical protein
MYLFDIKALTWAEYYYGRAGFPIQLIGNGLLLKGVRKLPESAPGQ